MAEDQKALHLRNRKSFSTWTNLVWWRWSTDRDRNKFSRHAGYRNNDWTDPTKCELWHEHLSKRSVLMQIFFCRNANAHDFARTSHDCCKSRESSLLSETVTVRFHPSPMPCESEPVYVEPVPEAKLDSSKVGLCKKSFKDSRIILRPGIFTENKRLEL